MRLLKLYRLSVWCVLWERVPSTSTKQTVHVYHHTNPHILLTRWTILKVHVYVYHTDGASTHTHVYSYSIQPKKIVFPQLFHDHFPSLSSLLLDIAYNTCTLAVMFSMLMIWIKNYQHHKHCVYYIDCSIVSLFALKIGYRQYYNIFCQ